MNENGPKSIPAASQIEWIEKSWDEEGPEAQEWNKEADAYEEERERREREYKRTLIDAQIQEKKDLIIPQEEETGAHGDLINDEMDRLGERDVIYGDKYWTIGEYGINKQTGQVMVSIKRLPVTPGDQESHDFNYVPKSPGQTFEDTVKMFEAKAEEFRIKYGADRGFLTGKIRTYFGVFPRRGRVMMCEEHIAADFRTRWVPASELKPIE